MKEVYLNLYLRTERAIDDKVRLAEDRPKFTYYDASFAALAKQERAVLVTANPKHQIKAAGLKVVALEDYK